MNRPVVHVLTQGNMANQMVQLLVARRIADAVPGCEISNVSLPHWAIAKPILPSAGSRERLVEGQQVDVEELAQHLRDGSLERVNLLAYGQWLSNFPTRAVAEALFPAAPARYPGYDRDHLVCNIRGGEVLDGRHPHYTLLPPAFYQSLAAQTGLRLVFMGQLDDTAYTRRLLDLFPRAIYRPSEGPLADFQVFRNSVNLVPGISTFSWLAAWLSDAARVILPVSGLFHPVQMPEIDLLPLDDPRYEFHLFPINYSVPVDRFEEAHRAIDGRWRRMPPAVLADIRNRTHQPFGIDQVLPFFDEDYYRQAYPDISAAISRGELATGRGHYVSNGFMERRRPFAFDRRWYAAAYPMAAFEVGQGDYATLCRHYCAIGASRGYWPTPR